MHRVCFAYGFSTGKLAYGLPCLKAFRAWHRLALVCRAGFAAWVCLDGFALFGSVFLVCFPAMLGNAVKSILNGFLGVLRRFQHEGFLSV